MSDLVLYKDKDFNKPFITEHIGRVEAGDIKTVEGYILNETDFDMIKLDYTTMDESLTIDNMPKQLEAHGWQKVAITFTPDAKRKEGLNSFISLTGKKVIPAE